MRTENLKRLVRIVVASARAHGQRVVLGVSPQALGAGREGPDVLAVDGIPHRWLFPRMRYILHHGGAGTTGAAARAGIPSTAIPFSADQVFWARRIYRLGLGPAAPPARRLTRDQVDALLQDALTDPAYQHRAHVLGERLRRDDGVASALQVIHAQLGIR
jgi:UDP:flavonoid glycosyltransferase YjiC (YdhE family)